MKLYLFTYTKIVVTLLLLGISLTACANTPDHKANDTETQSNNTTSDGAYLFEQWHCGDCHRSDGKGPAPSLVGIAGKSITLSNGERVLVDEEYVRTSILEPNTQIHEGYQPIMPALAEQIGVDGVSTLVAYILSLE